MPVNVSYPGLYIEEMPSSAHSITAAPTSITVFVGYVHPLAGECAKHHAWGVPQRIFSFADYLRIFGPLYRHPALRRSDVGYAVNQFFLNGGADAYVVGLQPRFHDTAHPATPPQDVHGAATPSFSGIVFTSQQLTDDDQKMTITIRNVRTTTNAGDTADIMITYGQQVESYRGVKLLPGLDTTHTDESAAGYDKDFIENRLENSNLVTVAPFDTTNNAYPAAFSIAGREQSMDLTDMGAPAGWTTLDTQQFVDVFQADTPLDKIDIFNILCIPGISDNAVWSEALHFCADKRAFFVMDPPEEYSADGYASLPTIESFVESPAMPRAVPNGALYFPYLKSLDPTMGDVLSLPPSGFVAGVYARTDTNRGVWKAPAGLETSLLNTTGVVDEGRMSDMRQGTLNPLGVNVLRSFPGSGTVVWGARTITISSTYEQWRYVPVRRTALFIEQSLLRSLGWVVFEPNDEPLWSAIRLSIENFMLSLFRQSAFQGSTPSAAFFVKCDATTTLQTDIDAGRVIIQVGFRPLKPAEFVIIQISQLAGQVQA